MSEENPLRQAYKMGVLDCFGIFRKYLPHGKQEDFKQELDELLEKGNKSNMNNE